MCDQLKAIGKCSDMYLLHASHGYWNWNFLALNQLYLCWQSDHMIRDELRNGLVRASNDPRIRLYHEPPPLVSEPTWLAYDTNLTKQSIVSMLWAQKQGNKALFRDDGGQLSHRGNFWPVARRPGTLGCGVNSKKLGNAETSFQTSSVGVPRRSITCDFHTVSQKWVIPWHEKRRKTSERKRLLNNGTKYYMFINCDKYIKNKLYTYKSL